MKIEDELKMPLFANEKQKAILSILFTASWLENQINQTMKDFDLSHQQYNILRILKGSAPKALSVLDIKSRMIDKMSNVSRLIEKLKQKDFLTRQEHTEDRRLVQVALTEAGRQVVDKISQKIPQNSDFTQNITDEEATQLVAMLDKLRG